MYGFENRGRHGWVGDVPFDVLGVAPGLSIDPESRKQESITNTEIAGIEKLAIFNCSVSNPIRCQGIY